MADAISAFSQVVWTFVYISFALTSGWVIMKGLSIHLPWHARLLGRLGFGFIALLCAIALAPLIPVGGTGIFRLIFSMMQINLFVAGMISTIVFAVSLFLISNKIYNIRGVERSIDRLKMRLEKARDFEKKMEGKKGLRRILRPVNIIGIVIFAAFLVIAFASFRGFPDPAKNIQNATGNLLSDLGVTPEDIRTICMFLEGYNQTGGFSADCAGPLELMQAFNVSSPEGVMGIVGRLPVYVDSGMESLIESNSGETVAFMYRLEHGQRAYALAITTKQSICTATGTGFCGCISLGTMV